MMYLLCKNGENHMEWYVISASNDRSALQDEADKRNREEDELEHSDWISRGKTGYEPLALDDPRRKGYRTFFVCNVPVWPKTECQ